MASERSDARGGEDGEFPGFVGVRGHREAQAMLARALGRGQLHHALMLVGPRGIGKATLARGLASALLCRASPGIGCGVCHTCTRIQAGTHPDVDWLLPSGTGGQITIDSARECHVRQQNGPYESERYVVVVDPADALNEYSGNALLKAIEEPRPGIHFLLLTTNMQGVLPTILSRTLPIRLGRLADADVAAIVAREAADAADDRRQMAVLLAEGSAGVAVELALDPALDRCLELVRQAIRAAAEGPPGIFAGDKSPLWESYTSATREVAAIEAAATAEAEEAEAAIAGKKKRKSKKKETKGKASAAQQRWVANRLAELWILHLREQLRGRQGLPGAPVLRGLTPAELVRQIGILQRLTQRIRRNANVRLILEQTLLEIAGRRAA
ncbi:MAG: hypothetical protein KC486_04445 [Myxococcales bacterium]|nr:hypothetical protein [Myxococcales bacterium]